MVKITGTAVFVIAMASLFGCGGISHRQSPENTQKVEQGELAETIEAKSSSMEHSHPTPVNTESNYDRGYTKISKRENDEYYEGIIDANGKQVVPLCTRLLVADIAGNVALIQFETKFLFVPLDGSVYSKDDLASVNGFQYAEPYQCGLAMVSVDDVRFYINSNFEKAFDSNFEFAESFHQNRALVMSDKKYRIIDTDGKTVADLNFDQVMLQSEWCWQVINKLDGKYKHGFVDLNGRLITELVYDKVGYYDPEVKRIWVRCGDRYGFLDEHAKVVIPLKYEYAEIFSRGKAKVILDGRTFFIDPDGNEAND
jgi:hypothetical protein